MRDNAHKLINLRLFPKVIVVVAILWTVMVGSSATWNLYQERSQTLALARKEALANFNKDLAFRLWATKHGGVYVPATDQTPPNPYLSHIPERDIVLPSGTRLTLMNPAYMVRQMMADFSELYGVKGRITSLKPLNPDNAPDVWEQQALAAFEKGIKEFFEIEKFDSSPYLRLMRPLETKAGCLKCHGHQGYREGDIRGGVGVSVPLAAYLALEKTTILAMSLSHLLIWGLGMASLGLVYVRGKRLLVKQAHDEEELRTLNEQLDRRVRERTLALEKQSSERKRIEEELAKANEALEQRVSERTAELRQKKEELDGFFNVSLDLLCIADTDGNFRLLNKAWERTLGYSCEELLSKKVFEFIHPDDLQATLAAVARLDSQQAVINFINRYRCKNGEYRFLEWRSAPSGKLIYAAARDITERIRAEEETRRSAKEWIAAMDASEDVIYLLDLDRRLMRANKAFFKMTGSTPATALGKHIVELVHPQGEKVPCPVCRAQEEKQDLSFVMEHDHPENPAGRPIEIVLKTVRDDEGRPMSMLMMLHDLTHERKVQDELIKHREHLEELVKSRTAEIEKQKAEVERLNKLFVGRELKMVELKARIAELEKQTG